MQTTRTDASQQSENLGGSEHSSPKNLTKKKNSVSYQTEAQMPNNSQHKILQCKILCFNVSV